MSAKPASQQQRRRISAGLGIALGTALLATPTVGFGAESGVWQLPAVGQALSGGLHVVYADRSDAGMADVYAGLSVLSQDDVLSSTLGASRVGYRIGAVFPIVDMFEAGVDIAGASVSARGNGDELSSFGDIRLRAKYYKRMHALGLAAVAGYDLYQGVEDRSTVADVATPLIGVGISYFGRDCNAPNPARLHLNANYVYDRTINFLGGNAGTPGPSRFERFAWQMRDYTYLDVKAGAELELPGLLPIVEYGLEVPIDDTGRSRELIHRVSPGVKFNPVAALAVVASVDFGFGGDPEAAPAVPLVDVRLGLTYRFKGDIGKPVASAAADDEPMTEAAPADAATPATDTPDAGSTEEMPAPQDAPVPAQPVPAPVEPTPSPAPEAEATQPPAEETPATPPPPAPKPEAPPKPRPSGPVDLEQFAE